MTEKNLDFLDILVKFSEAPDSQIDKSITDKMKELLSKNGTITKSEMKAILDDCAYFSLASDFAMRAMRLVWKELV